MARELIGGAAALALAIAYWVMAAGLPVSLLSDEVGADGVPKALAWSLGILGALQIARALFARHTAEGDDDYRRHLRALGLLLIAVAYMAVTPYLGYLLGTMALIYAAAAYAGQRQSWRLAAVSAGGGLVLWASFAKLLGISMPAGFLG